MPRKSQADIMSQDRNLVKPNREFDYVFHSGPRRLGIRSEEIIRRKILRGEKMFGEPLSNEPERVICGVYERGVIVDNATIKLCRGINDFYFHTNILTSQNQEIMNLSPRIRFPNKCLMYAANPYNSDLGQIKLYLRDTKVFRCKIKDLYCEARNLLRLKCDVSLLDTGEYIKNISYDCIYDFPQVIDYLAELEPEAKPARLYLSERHEEFMNKNVDKGFREIIKNANATFKIKIFDYKNDIYHVDIIEPNGDSVTAQLKEAFPQFKRFYDHVPDRQISQSPQGFQLVHQILSHKNHKNNLDVQHIRYFDSGACSFFKYKIDAIDEDDMTQSHIAKRFFKVKILNWCDPESFSIIPADEEYIECHERFKRSIQETSCIKSAESEYYREHEPYEPDEFVVFKNEFGEPKLGEWLRGIVVSVSRYNNYNLSIGTQTGKYKNLADVKKMIKDKILEPEDLIYRVRSIDYGFQCKSSHISMRHIRNLNEFRKVGPWSLRCRLFGIGPLQNESDKFCQGQFSSACLDMIDCWMRERLLDNSKNAFFHVLFRSNIVKEPHWKLFCGHIEISLFHRYEPPYSIESAFLLHGRRTRFDCLNSYLVDRGFASDTWLRSIASRVQLDEYIVNMLVQHNRI